MKYQGSKNRIAKDIIPLILGDKNIRYWVEPFVGGANMIDKISDEIIRIGYDNNKYLIALFNAVKNGWIPPDNISESEYADIKNNKEKYDDFLVGFVGIGCSFAGKWFGGYARGGTRNYCLESKNNLLKQAEKIKNVEFFYQDYRDIILPSLIPEKTVIYCDPPYANTTKYHSNFDHYAFWRWADNLSDKGYNVFVSEYSTPQDISTRDWICIYEKEIISNLDLNTGNKKSTEKLFTKLI